LSTLISYPRQTSLATIKFEPFDKLIARNGDFKTSSSTGRSMIE